MIYHFNWGVLMKARTRQQLENRNQMQILIYRLCVQKGISISMEKISELFRQLNIQGRNYGIIKKIILQQLRK